ncbi:MAG: hypothetical protein J2P36_36500, partial [Ktedonobacteraceae bacterium]|nr:hypothetical protein [Ktedonobacteraceae bacterium]
GTANALGTTQANINATATAMGNNAAMATASSEAATATASAFSDMLTRATSGKPVLDDPLSDNSGPGKWDEGSPSTNTGCTFQGLYNVQEATQGYLQPCIAEASNFSDFSYQISLSITQGYQGRAGLLFHVDSSKKAFYFFHIGTDNTYALDLYQGTGKVDTLSRGLSYTISAGLNQSNQLAVIAHDTTYDLFINGGYVASVTDGTLGAGKVGVAVIDNGTPVTAQFSDAKVWQGRS